MAKKSAEASDETGPARENSLHGARSTSKGPLHNKRVFVVDAHSLIHQLFHAIPEMTSPDGQPVNAVFGFIRDTLHILKHYKPDYLICAFDSKEPTFRREIYEAYKAQRPELDADIIPQIDLIEEFLQAMGIPVIRVSGFEADDLMATLASEVEKGGGDCVLVTTDKDCRQLLSEHVKLLNLRKDAFFDRQNLMQEWGVTPEQVVDFQALVGDSSDNVPGVPQIGPKAAQQLLQEYGTLDNLLQHMSEISSKRWQENLEKYRDQVLLSRELVQLRRDVPLPCDWDALRLRPANREAVLEFCRRLGFRRLISDLEQFLPKSEQQRVKKRLEWRTVTVTSLDELKQHLASWQNMTEISLDTETTDIRPRWARLVGISLAPSENEGFYIPIRAPLGEPVLPESEVLQLLAPILNNAKIKKIGQHLKYDWVVLRGAGVQVTGIAFDCMLADYLLSPGSRSHGLDELASRLLGHITVKIESLIGKGKKQQKTMDQVPVEKIAPYAVEDAILPWHLKQQLEPQLKKHELFELFTSLEIPLVEILAEMEFYGVRVDEGRLAILAEEFQKRIQQAEEAIYELAGHRFNIASPKQLQEVLFDELKLPSSKRTKTGISTDSEVLEELGLDHPLPAKIIEYRQFAKLKSTYVDALREMICPYTGRVHASFHQAVTATGRLSCSDPNLQNIPVRTEEGRAIRSAFVAPAKDWVLISADYSQIELRILAHFCQDPRLCEAFRNDEDIHTAVAAEVFGVSLDQVTPEMRRRAKTVNFGVIYGQTPLGLAKQLRIPKEEAAAFIEAYFARYHGIEDFLQQVLRSCRQNGYVSTIMGRKRFITGVRENPTRQRNLPERTAVNTVIQGSAADLIKKAMIRVRACLQERQSRARMILQVHDELVFECPPDERDSLAQMIREEMEGIIRLSVPLKVDVAWGPNWADRTPVAR